MAASPLCPQCATPLVYMPQFNGWFCSRCNTYPHSSPRVQPASAPDHGWAVIMSGFNGAVALLASLFYFTLIPFLGVFMVMVSLVLISGAILISREDYNLGSILCFIGGVITMPIGILGFMAGMKAWDCHKRQQMPAYLSPVPPPKAGFPTPGMGQKVVFVEPIKKKVTCPKCRHSVVPMRIGRCPRCGYRFHTRK